MPNRPTLSLILAALALPGAALAAGEAGTAGFNFLKIAAGPRAEAMGEAQTSVADDAYAAYWNPGGLVQLRRPELSFSYSQHLEGVNEQFVSYAHPFAGGRALAASFTRLAVTPFEAYDNNGARNGSVSADDTAVGLAAAQPVVLPNGGPTVGLGAGARYVRERLGQYSAATVAGDAGLWLGNLDGWTGPWARGVRLGLAVRHFGPKAKFVRASTRLPTTYAAGLSLDRELWGDPFTLAAELSRGAAAPLAGSFGAEYWLHRLVGVRVGVLAGDQEGAGLRFGIGLRVRVVQVDYAFSSIGRLGNAHRIGLTMKFGVPPREAGHRPAERIALARDLLGQDRPYEAIRELTEALAEDPGNTEALDLLKDAKQQLQRLREREDRELMERTHKKLEQKPSGNDEP